MCGHYGGQRRGGISACFPYLCITATPRTAPATLHVSLHCTALAHAHAHALPPPPRMYHIFSAQRVVTWRRTDAATTQKYENICKNIAWLK